MPSLTKVKGIGISMICIILMAFILINPQLFFTGDPTAWQDVIFIYILLFLIAAKDNDPKSKTDDKKHRLKTLQVWSLLHFNTRSIYVSRGN